MEQMIKIDVPEGYEVGGKCEYYDSCTKKQWITLYLIKKEPEFIEIRAYLVKTDHDGLVYCSVQKGWDTPELVAKQESFVKWLDQDWRKVEI